MRALNLTGIEVPGSGDPRFPIRVAVMFFHEDIDGGKGVVIHQGGETARGAFDQDVFVDLIIAARGIDVGDLFVAAELMTKQAKVPIGEISVLEPFAHEHEAPVNPVAVHGVVRIGHDSAKLGFGVGREHFVGIENEHPFVTERQMGERPIFLLGPRAVEMKLFHLGTVRLSDFD